MRFEICKISTKLSRKTENRSAMIRSEIWQNQR